MAIPSTAIFIPAYEAEHTVEAVIDRIPKDLWESIETVFVINDGSTDDTSGAVRRAAARYPKVALHEQPVNQGYGTSVRKGLQLALGTPAKYVVCLHADGQYPPEKLPEFLPYMAQHGVDVLQGSRHKLGTARTGGMPTYKVISGHVLTWMENQDVRPLADRLSLGLHALQPARGRADPVREAQLLLRLRSRGDRERTGARPRGRRARHPDATTATRSRT